MRRFALAAFLIALVVGATNATATDQAKIDAYLKKKGPSTKSTSSGGGSSAFGVNLGGFAGMVDADFLFTDSSGPSIAWTGSDVKGDDFQFGAVGSAWYRSGDTKIQMGYQGLLMTSFSDNSSRDLNFGSATIPAGSDLDARLSIHHFTLEFHVDEMPLGESGEWTGGYSLGLGYDKVRMGLNSDGFPIADDSQSMQELIPYPIFGMHLTWAPKKEWKMMISARIGYLPEVPTLQKRDDEKISQETLFTEFSISDEYQINKWFALWGALSYQMYDHSLSADGPATGAPAAMQQDLEMSIFSVSFGLGLRF